MYGARREQLTFARSRVPAYFRRGLDDGDVSDGGEVAHERGAPLRFDQGFELFVEESGSVAAVGFGLLLEHLARVIEVLFEMAAELFSAWRRCGVGRVRALEVGKELNGVLAQLRARVLLDREPREQRHGVPEQHLGKLDAPLGR